MALWRYDRDTESTRWRHPSRRRDFRFATPSVRDRAFGQDRRDPPFPSDSGYHRNPRAPSTLVATIASMLPPHMVRDRCQPPAPWGDPRRLWLARSRGRQRVAIGHRTSVGVSEAATCASAVHRIRIAAALRGCPQGFPPAWHYRFRSASRRPGNGSPSQTSRAAAET